MQIIALLPSDKSSMALGKAFNNAIYTHLGYDFGELVIILMTVIYIIGVLGGIWIGSIEAYQTMAREPLTKTKKKVKTTTKAKSQVS